MDGLPTLEKPQDEKCKQKEVRTVCLNCPDLGFL